MAFLFNERNVEKVHTRSVGDWSTIFASQTNGTPDQMAERILGDLLGYNGGRNERYRDTDIRTLANAIAYICLEAAAP